MRIFTILLAAIALAGCRQNPQLPAVISPYRIDIQQGNVVTQEMVGKLKIGLTRSQVRYVLGSPLVIDVFHADRWDYVYLLQRQGKPDERRRLTVIFDGDKLTSLEGDVVLTEKLAEPELNVPKPPVTTAAPAPKPPAPSAAAGVQTCGRQTHRRDAGARVQAAGKASGRGDAWIETASWCSRTGRLGQTCVSGPRRGACV